MDRKAEILIVDDDVGLALNLQDILEAEGYNTAVAHDGQAARALSGEKVFDLAFVDIKLPDIQGVELIDKLADILPKTEFVIITGYATLETAIVAAGNRNVVAYQTKPLDMDHLLTLTRQLVGRKRAERALWESEVMFKALFENMSSGVAVYEAVDDGDDFVFKDFNRAGERIERIGREDIIGKRVTEAFPGVKEFGVFDVFQRVWRTGKPEYLPEGVYKDERDPGSWRENRVYKLPSGEVVAVYDDITERKRAEEGMERSAREWRTTFDAIGDAVCLLDPKGTILRCNTAMADLLGKSFEEIIGSTCWRLVHGTSEPIEGCPVQRMQKTRLRETFVLKTDGLYLKVTADPLIDEDENLKGCVHIITDITESKRMEQERIQMEKLSGLGTMAAGIAHELNNPMMGMLGFVEYCIKHTTKEDRKYTVLKDTVHEIKRCTDIVGNLLTFSRAEQGKEEYEKQSFTTIFDRVLRLLSYRITKENVSITQQIAEEASEIWMKTGNIQQVFLNLITNALDVLKESENKEIHVDVCPEGEFAQLTVSDTGCGIHPEDLQKIFDPFFTTKPAGQGTGLGLSVSQGIVKAHGGEITCESEVGKGTKFKVLLPIGRDFRSNNLQRGVTKWASVFW